MTLPILLLVAAVQMALASEYHVAVNGDDRNPGSPAKPFRTIFAAARVAQPGDTITVHAGTYRERVTPPRGGTSDSSRIVYQAAPGEDVTIKGSEIVKGWTRLAGGVWRVTLPESMFGKYNPFRDVINGDWFDAKGRVHHTGEVWLNGESLSESPLLDGVLKAGSNMWFAEADKGNVYLYADFGNHDPNSETVEVSVRDACFYPDQPGRNYITVRGFKMQHAATQWAAPTAEQIGLIGTHWSKGWIIENNTISDSRCSCVTLGKDRKSGHNVWNANPQIDGATHYNQVIDRVLADGWSRETIGSHIVRNNTIYNCEQAGIAGSMGAIFSTISGNHIYNVWRKRQFAGAEMGGIKLHGAIDVVIEANRIHNAGRGMWMDWMAQGTRITRNILYDNSTDDLFVEVNHGPFIVDNNLFLSAVSLNDWSEGVAYVHNLFAGKIAVRPEPSRKTPYHAAHSTQVIDRVPTAGGDNRFFNNVFLRDGSAAATCESVRGRAIGFGLCAYEALSATVMSGGNATLSGTTQPPASVAPVSPSAFGVTRVSKLPYECAPNRQCDFSTDVLGQTRKGDTVLPGPFATWPAKDLIPLP